MKSLWCRLFHLKYWLMEFSQSRDGLATRVRVICWLCHMEHFNVEIPFEKYTAPARYSRVSLAGKI